MAHEGHMGWQWPDRRRSSVRLAGCFLSSNLAEGEGFEPPGGLPHGCFQDSCHKPDSAIPPRDQEESTRNRQDAPSAAGSPGQPIRPASIVRRGTPELASTAYW